MKVNPKQLKDKKTMAGIILSAIIAFLWYMNTKLSKGNFISTVLVASGLNNSQAQELSALLYAQAQHETGNFKSDLFKRANNLFGMKAPNSRKNYTGVSNGYAVYSSWQSSLMDMVQYLKERSLPLSEVAKIGPHEYAYYLKGKNYYEDDMMTYSTALANNWEKFYA